MRFSYCPDYRWACCSDGAQDAATDLGSLRVPSVPVVHSERGARKCRQRQGSREGAAGTIAVLAVVECLLQLDNIQCCTLVRILVWRSC